MIKWVAKYIGFTGVCNIFWIACIIYWFVTKVSSSGNLLVEIIFMLILLLAITFVLPLMIARIKDVKSGTIYPKTNKKVIIFECILVAIVLAIIVKDIIKI